MKHNPNSKFCECFDCTFGSLPKANSRPQQRRVIQPGSKIVITGEHPWRGETGQYVRDETTPFGIKALVSLDNGTDCYAKHENLKAV